MFRITTFPFYFQAEDGIRDADVTGVQTCALPIWGTGGPIPGNCFVNVPRVSTRSHARRGNAVGDGIPTQGTLTKSPPGFPGDEIGRASCRERDKKPGSYESRINEA